jgi:hypothetical protein
MTLLRSKAYEKGMVDLGDTLEIMDIELLLSDLYPTTEEV